MEQSHKFFNEFKQNAFMINAAMKRLRDLSTKLGLEETQAQIEEQLKAIETQVFTIAVVGEFKRGKSTFINALLEDEILPADVIPTSATLNRVTYGSPGVHLYYRAHNGQEERVEEIPIDRLSEFVTKWTPEAEALASSIREAVISYPLAYCENNVDIVDTPGLNDEASMVEVTLSVLPKVDAAIFVIMPESPFSGSEGVFLENLMKQGIGQVMFVVTALDRIRNPEDRERVLELVRQRVRERINRYAEREFGAGTTAYQQYLRQNGEPRVYGLSSYLAIEGRKENNPSMIQESCFQDFKKVLSKFVTEEKGTIKLITQAERLLIYSEKVLKAVEDHEQVMLGLPQKYTNSINRLAVFLEVMMKIVQNETSLLDSAIHRSKEANKQRLTKLFPLLKNTLISTANKVEIKPEDLTNEQFYKLQNRLGNEINLRLNETAHQFCSELRQELESEINKEIERLIPFMITFDHCLRLARNELALLDQQLENGNAAGKGQAITTFEEQFGIQATFEKVAISPTSWAVNQLQNSLVVGRLAPKLLPPPTWFSAIPIQMRASVGGPDLFKKAADIARINAFRVEYRTNSEHTLVNLVKAMTWENDLYPYVQDGFEPIKQMLLQAFSITQLLLVELRGKRERLNISVQHRLGSLAETRTEVQQIQRSGNQLLEKIM
jgi:GTPase SAR1 family protein